MSAGAARVRTAVLVLLGLVAGVAADRLWCLDRDGGGSVPGRVRVGDDDTPALAVVDGERLTVRDMTLRWNEVLTAPERHALRRQGGLPTYLDECVEEILLAQEARRRGLDRDPGVAEALRSAANHVITRPLLLEEVRDKAFAEDELRALYERRRDEWGQPLRVRVQEILVPVQGTDDAAWEEGRQKASALRDRVLAGEDFAALARTESAAPTARYGGEVGWVVAGRFFASYEQAALALQPGDLSEPVRTEGGWVLLRAEDREEERFPTFEAKRDELVDELSRDDPGAPARRYRIFVDGLKAAHDVRVDASLLDQVEDRDRPAR